MTLFKLFCLFIEKCDGVISQCHNLLRRMTCRSKAGRKSILDCVAPKPGWQIFGCAPLCRWVAHSYIPLFSWCWNIDDSLVGQLTTHSVTYSLFDLTFERNHLLCLFIRFIRHIGFIKKSLPRCKSFVIFAFVSNKKFFPCF